MDMALAPWQGQYKLYVVCSPIMGSCKMILQADVGPLKSFKNGIQWLDSTLGDCLTGL